MAIAFVQSATAFGALGNNTSATTGNITTTAGNLVVLMAYGQTNVGDFVASDSKSNTWHQAVQQITNNGSGSNSVALFYTYNLANAGAGHNFTITTAAGMRIMAIAQEFSGILTSGDPLDKTAVNGNSSTSSGATATTSVANELVVGVMGMQSFGADPTAGSGYSNFVTGQNTSQAKVGSIESKVVSSTGTQTATFGTDATESAGTFATLVATFEGTTVAVNSNFLTFM